MMKASRSNCPMEVESGWRPKAKSLKSYIERYLPERTVKLVGKAGGSDRKSLVLPLYYAGKLNDILYCNVRLALSTLNDYPFPRDLKPNANHDCYKKNHHQNLKSPSAYIDVIKLQGQLMNLLTIEPA